MNMKNEDEGKNIYKVSYVEQYKPRIGHKETTHIFADSLEDAKEKFSDSYISGFAEMDTDTYEYICAREDFEEYKEQQYQEYLDSISKMLEEKKKTMTAKEYENFIKHRNQNRREEERRDRNRKKKENA